MTLTVSSAALVEVVIQPRLRARWLLRMVNIAAASAAANRCGKPRKCSAPPDLNAAPRSQPQHPSAWVGPQQTAKIGAGHAQLGGGVRDVDSVTTKTSITTSGSRCCTLSGTLGTSESCLHSWLAEVFLELSNLSSRAGGAGAKGCSESDVGGAAARRVRHRSGRAPRSHFSPDTPSGQCARCAGPETLTRFGVTLVMHGCIQAVGRPGANAAGTRLKKTSPAWAW